MRYDSELDIVRRDSNSLVFVEDSWSIQERWHQLRPNLKPFLILGLAWAIVSGVQNAWAQILPDVIPNLTLVSILTIMWDFIAQTWLRTMWRSIIMPEDFWVAVRNFYFLLWLGWYCGCVDHVKRHISWTFSIAEDILDYILFWDANHLRYSIFPLF